MKAVKGIDVLIVLAVVAISTIAVFVSTAAAQEEGDDPKIKFYGTITDAEGNPYVGHTVEIKKKSLGLWRSMGTDVTDSNGSYEIGYTRVLRKKDTYKMYIDGKEVDERYIDNWTYDGWWFITYWSYRWDYQIPEFTNIAIPAAAMLGLLFIFNHRKRRK
ncbi:MAG: hypothetical protein OCU24_06860 [Candidatus Methanospirare jalkutatii]|nr:hypothetical protein [Candidatus Methanospirare jalkutatii]